MPRTHSPFSPSCRRRSNLPGREKIPAPHLRSGNGRYVRVVAAADAMREKRRELIALPLAQVYVQLARAGLEAAERMRASNLCREIDEMVSQ